MKYDEFIAEGTLVIMDGTILDMEEVYADLEEHIQTNKYDVRTLGYDPYNAKVFLEQFIIDYGPHAIEKVIQGRKTESVPLGEIKKMASERMFLFDEMMMQWTMGNAVVLMDVNGNKMLVKDRAIEKIDNVSALMDAFIAWKLNKEEFE